MGELEKRRIGGGRARIGIKTVFQGHQGLGTTAQIFVHVDTPAALRHAATNHLRQTIFTGAFVIGMAISHINDTVKLHAALWCAGGLRTGKARSQRNGSKGEQLLHIGLLHGLHLFLWLVWHGPSVVKACPRVSACCALRTQVFPNSTIVHLSKIHRQCIFWTSCQDVHEQRAATNLGVNEQRQHDPCVRSQHGTARHGKKRNVMKKATRLATGGLGQTFKKAGSRQPFIRKRG